MVQVIKFPSVDAQHWTTLERDLRGYLVKLGIAGAALDRVIAKVKVAHETMPHPSLDLPAAIATTEVQRRIIEPLKANAAALMARIVELCVVMELEGLE